MPGPVSRTSTSPLDRAASTIVPPRGVTRSALSSSPSSTWRSRAGSARTTSGAGSATTETPAARPRAVQASAVAVVGDGALTGGLTWEGLANAGDWPSPLVVVINDNQSKVAKGPTQLLVFAPR